MEDPYQILGVQKSDSDKAIRASYRKLAKRFHPDLNPGKPEALERFKEISVAYDLLSDPVKRGRYDRGEIDAVGNEKPPEHPYYSDMRAGRAPGGGPQLRPEDLEEIFGAAFSEHFGGRARRPSRGSDMRYGLTVSFLDAANGAVRRLTLPDGETLDVTIPPGLRDGHVLRLKGKGLAGPRGGPPGDALIEVSVAPHPYFRREGNDVVVELPVTLQEAVLGATVEVPTITGKVRLTIPPHSGNGRRLRLAGRGIAGGNQVVELKLALPSRDEPALADFLRGWNPEHPLDPRKEFDEP